MRRIFATLLLIVTPVCEGGTLTVTVLNSKGTPASDAVVWAIPEGRSVPVAARAKGVMDQRNRQFVPHVLPVQTGTSVSFPNSDNVRHQVYSFSPAKSFQLPLYIGNAANPVTFDRPGIVAIGCNIHDQMSAFIVVVDTPHFARTPNDGRVEIENLPQGSYAIHVWHPRMADPFEPVRVAVPGKTARELTISIRDE